MDNNYGLDRAYVCEDTCLLAPGVSFAAVENATQNFSGSIFGYGKYELTENNVSWFGSKGLCVSAQWWRPMSIVLENMNVEQFRHFDLWLKSRRANGITPNIDLAAPLVGYGHRMSLTSRMGPVFGGAWLPMDSAEEAEAAVLASSPQAVREWVQECRRRQPNIMRGYAAPVPFQCPFSAYL